MTSCFPLVFCLTVCSGFGTVTALIVSSLFVLLMPELQPKKLMPLIISFIIIGNSSGNRLLTSLIFGALLLIYSLLYNKLNHIIAFKLNSGIILAGALTSTVLFTTLYFGIGASGNNVTEMIKSYVSLGFHPNWRGVLFGTIVLVLMITFPRKFKTVSNYISAPFIALLITLILNLFLNPSDMVSAISEIKGPDLNHFKGFIQSAFTFKYNISSVLNGIALFLLCLNSLSDKDNISKKDYIICSGTNILSCGIFSMPFPYEINKNKNTFIPRIIAVIVLCASFFFLKDFIARIPLHSCAVVVIVSAWDNVKWYEIKNSFLNTSTAFVFVISFICSMLSNISFGIIVSFILTVIYNLINGKKRPAE